GPRVPEDFARRANARRSRRRERSRPLARRRSDRRAHPRSPGRPSRARRSVSSRAAAPTARAIFGEWKRRNEMLEQIAEKMKSLKIVLSTVEKQFGKGAIMSLGDDAEAEPIATIRTGSLALDLATGIGGYPRGRVVEIYGPESSGKTTLALHAI